MSQLEEAEKFITGLLNIGGLSDATRYLQANLSRLNEGFIPAFFVVLGDHQTSNLDQILIRMALSRAVRQLDFAPLSREARAFALLFSDDPVEMLPQASPYIDLATCRLMYEIAGSLDAESNLISGVGGDGEGVARSAARNLRKLVSLYGRFSSAEHIQPLMDMLSTGCNPLDLLAETARRARGLDSWLVEALEGLYEMISSSRPGVQDGMAALLAHATIRAHEEWLEDDDPDRIAETLQRELLEKVAAWAQTEYDQDLISALAELGSWLTWGGPPPRPYLLLSRAADIHSRDALWALVTEEPWFLSQPGMEMLGQFQGMSPQVPLLMMWLAEWASTLVEPDANPILGLAKDVVEGRLTLEAASDEARAAVRSGRLEVPHLAAIDERIQGELIDEAPEVAMAAAALNHGAGRELGEPLMQAYAALTLGATKIDRRPASEIIEPFEEAAAIARRLDQPLVLSQALVGLGKAYAVQDRFDEALPYLKEAGVVERRLPIGIGREELGITMAQVYVETRYLDEARRVLRRFERPPERLQAHGRIPYRYWLMRGSIAYERGEMEEALAHWEEAKRIAAAINSPRLLNEVTQAISRVVVQMGDVEGASRLLEDALGTFASGHETHVEVLLTQGMIAHDQGLWAQSKDLFEQALIAAREGGLPFQELRAHQFLGYLYNEIGQLGEAHAQWRACQDLFARFGEWPGEELIVTMWQATTYSKEHDYARASVMYRRALRQARRLRDRSKVEYALSGLVTTYLNLERFDMARLILRVAESQARPSSQSTLRGLRGQRGELLARQGRAAWKEGDAELARRLFEEAAQVWLALAEEARGDGVALQQSQAANSSLKPPSRGLPETYYNLALLYEEEPVADPRRAGHFYREAIRVTEAQGRNLMSGELRARYMGDKSYLYRMAIDSLLAAGDLKGAVEVAEMARARYLGEKVTQLESVPHTLPQEMQQNYRLAWGRFQQASSAWLNIEMGTTDNIFQRERSRSSPTVVERKALSQQYREAHAALQREIARVHEYDPAFQPREALDDPDFERDVKGLLLDLGDSTMALVHLQVLDEYTLALISTLGAEEPIEVHLPLSRQQMNVLLYLAEGAGRGMERLMGERMKSPFGGDWTREAGKAETLTLTLGNHIWKELHPQLQALGIRRVVLLPDNVLSMFPLHVASLSNTEAPVWSPRLWVPDVYEVTIAPSAQLLRLLRARAQRRPPTTSSGVVLAQTTTHRFTPAIVGMVDEGLDTPAWVAWNRVGGNETKELETVLSESALLHIQAHGCFKVNQPGQTYLQIEYEGRGGVGRDTRWLTLDDVARDLSLRSNRLTVLGACESSMIELARLAEFGGLPAAFMLAGSAAVVAALWPVDDVATMLLFSRFYRALGEGETIAAALGRAQRELRALRRDEVIAELSALRGRCAAWADEFETDGQAAAFTTTYYALDAQATRLRWERGAIRELQMQLSGLEGEAVGDAILAARERTPLEYPDWSDRLWDLYSRYGMDKQDAVALIARLDEVEHHPFGHPYYWGGFQAWGAAV